MALSPTSSRGSSGGSSAVTRCIYNNYSTPTSCASDDFTDIAWVQIPVLGDLTPLLDLTNPQVPKPLVAGTYGISGFIEVHGANHAGKFIYYVLSMDSAAHAVGSTDVRELTSGGLSTVIDGSGAITLPISGIWYMTTSQTIEMFVYHDAGVSLNISLAAAVQRLA